MWSWVQRCFGRPMGTDQAFAGERVLTLEREIQSLRLELEEGSQVTANLKRELERQRGTEGTRLTEAVRAQVERLMTDLASPVAQLLTQAHLLDVDGKPIQAKDVLTVAKRLVRTLEDNGFTVEGCMGEAIPFDPNRHELLSANVSPVPGEKVVVKFVGASYLGKVIKKAGVAKS